MIAEPLEKGLAEDIENEVVQITWNRYDVEDITLRLKSFNLCDRMFSSCFVYLQISSLCYGGIINFSVFQSQSDRSFILIITFVHTHVRMMPVL